jgi:hypothetical protein
MAGISLDVPSHSSARKYFVTEERVSIKMSILERKLYVNIKLYYEVIGFACNYIKSNVDIKYKLICYTHRGQFYLG